MAYNVDGTLDYDLLEGTEVPKSDVLLNLLHRNVAQNRHLFQRKDDSNLASVEELDWTVPNHADQILYKYAPDGFDLLFASDVTYITSLHAPLASTIARLLSKQTSSSSSSICWIAHQERVVNLLGEDFQLKSFLEALKQEGLQAAIHEASLVDRKDDDIEDGGLVDQDERNLVNGPVKLLKIQHDDASHDAKESELWIP